MTESIESLTKRIEILERYVEYVDNFLAGIMPSTVYRSIISADKFGHGDKWVSIMQKLRMDNEFRVLEKANKGGSV